MPFVPDPNGTKCSNFRRSGKSVCHIKGVDIACADCGYCEKFSFKTHRNCNPPPSYPELKSKEKSKEKEKDELKVPTLR